MRPGVVSVALLAGLLACSGSPVATPSGSPSAPAQASPSASASPLRVGRVAAPSVRLFAGTQSIAGVAVRYCLRGDCVERPATPARLVVDDGSVVTFAVGRAPEKASVETGGLTSVLAPATLMAMPDRLARGAHRLTLRMAWAEAEGVWSFDLVAR